MSGLLLVLIAMAFLVDDLTALDLDGRWAAPLVLIGVGAAGLASSLRSAERGSTAP